MYCQNDSFLSKMKPRYSHVSLGFNKGPPSTERLRGGGLKVPQDLEKWKTSVFPCSKMRPNFFKNKETIL